MYSEQITQYRREYDEKIQQLQSRIKELEDWNEAHQGLVSTRLQCRVNTRSRLFSSDDELRKSMEVQKEVVCFFLEITSEERTESTLYHCRMMLTKISFHMNSNKRSVN